MPEERKNYFLGKPSFGMPPEVKPFGEREPVRFEFEDLLEMVRQRPGEEAQISEYKGSNRKKVHQEARASRARLWRYLTTRYPLEEWTVRVYPTPDTWCDKELWVCYRGVMTPEEALKLRTLRQQRYSKKANAHLDPRAAHEARLHAKAVLRDRENRRGSPDFG